MLLATPLQAYIHTAEKTTGFPKPAGLSILISIFISDKAVVADIAMSGRSAKGVTQKKSNFKVFKDNISEGDFLILQFGHNDSKIQDPVKICSGIW